MLTLGADEHSTPALVYVVSAFVRTKSSGELAPVRPNQITITFRTRRLQRIIAAKVISKIGPAVSPICSYGNYSLHIALMEMIYGLPICANVDDLERP